MHLKCRPVPDYFPENDTLNKKKSVKISVG